MKGTITQAIFHTILILAIPATLFSMIDMADKPKTKDSAITEQMVHEILKTCKHV